MEIVVEDDHIGVIADANIVAKSMNNDESWTWEKHRPMKSLTHCKNVFPSTRTLQM
ncbi:hypothetical protein V7O66_04545 [Methanolobus sp. ZRKC3]|uniref:hypothetical protein n=1 Tax=Methanolobus sp. ZRKC3 TaxID=3125786 RepID=UPI00324C8341